eukprot:6866852-Prymnesium_polylepis.1
MPSRNTVTACSVSRHGTQAEMRSPDRFHASTQTVGHTFPTSHHPHACRDPATTRCMFAARVLLGKTYEYAADQHDKALRAPPDGHDSVAGFLRGQRELVVYENSRVLL